MSEHDPRYLLDRSDWSVERLYTIPEAAALLCIDRRKLVDKI